MRKEFYVCDVCGREQDYRDMAHIDVKTHGTIRIKDVDNYIGKSVDVCRPCLEKVGFTFHQNEDGAPSNIAEAPQGKNLEDLLLDLLQAAGVQFE